MNRKTSNGSLTTRSRIEKTRKRYQQQYGLARKNGSRHLDRLYTRECLLAQSRHASECSQASDVNIIDTAPQQPCHPKTNLEAYGDKPMTVTLVIEPESSNPPQELQISTSLATSEPPSRTQSPQRKRTSKRYSSRWSSGVQLETLIESQEILLTSPEAHNQHQQHEITNDKDGDGDGDWETVIGGSQQFCHPSSSSGNILLLAHSDAGSSIADYTSFASFSASERFMSPPANRRKKRRYASLSSSPWNDSPMDFLTDSPRTFEQHGPKIIHPSNALSDGGYPKLPPSPGRKRAVVPVLSSTFTYHHPTPLQRSHSNPFKVTPPYLDWRRDDDDDDDIVEILDQSSVVDQEDLDLPSGTVIHHSPQIYTPGASIADISTGIPSTWPSEADFNAISPTTAATPASTTAFQPSTPCPYERVYEGRYPPFRHGIGLKGVGGYFPPTNRLIDEDSSPVVKVISRADSPTSWHGSICNVSVSDADADADAEADLTESFEGAFPDSVDLLWKDKGNAVDEGRRRKARSYYSIGMTPRSLKADIAQGLRRLSGISTERHSRKSFVLLPDGNDDDAGDDKITGRPQEEPIIPKRCFIRKVSTARPYSEYPSGSRRTSQLPRDFIPVRDSSRAQTKRNSVLSFRTSKRENELLRKRLTQIDLEGFTDIELDDRKQAATAAQQSRSSQLRAKERVQGWLSTDMGARRQSQFQHHKQPPPPAAPPTMDAVDKTLQQLEEAEEATHEWYRSQHGKYAFPQPPRLIAQHELHAIRRKSLHPRPPSSDPHDTYLEIEYIVKQRRLGKQILLCCSLCAPIGWLVVAYIGFEGSRSDGVMQWRSHGVVAGFHEKERRMARALAVVQAVAVLVMIVVVPTAVLA